MLLDKKNTIPHLNSSVFSNGKTVFKGFQKDLSTKA